MGEDFLEGDIAPGPEVEKGLFVLPRGRDPDGLGVLPPQDFARRGVVVQVEDGPVLQVEHVVGQDSVVLGVEAGGDGRPGGVGLGGKDGLHPLCLHTLLQEQGEAPQLTLRLVVVVPPESNPRNHKETCFQKYATSVDHFNLEKVKIRLKL